LGGRVDEELASLELEEFGGAVSIELDGPSELGLVLERGGTSLRRTLACDPGAGGDLRVDWPSTDLVDVRLVAGGLDRPVSAPVLLVPLDAAEVPASFVQLDAGRASAQCVVPGRYFFRVELADGDLLVCGVAEHVAGASELLLAWSGCPLPDADSADADAGVMLEAIDGTSLSSVPARLRTLTPPRTTEAETWRPSRLRLPCSCTWSPVRQPIAAADPTKEPK